MSHTNRRKKGERESRTNANNWNWWRNKKFPSILVAVAVAVVVVAHSAGERENRNCRVWWCFAMHTLNILKYIKLKKMRWHGKHTHGAYRSYRATQSKQVSGKHMHKNACTPTRTHTFTSTRNIHFHLCSAKFLSIENGTCWKSGSSKRPTTTATTTTKNTKKKMQDENEQIQRERDKKSIQRTKPECMNNAIVHESCKRIERQSERISIRKPKRLCYCYYFGVLADDETMIKIHIERKSGSSMMNPLENRASKYTCDSSKEWRGGETDKKRREMEW